MSNREFLFSAIRSIAPETDPEAIDPNAPLRDEIDLDSMDFLNLVTKVHRELGVDIPERDYSRIATLNDFVSYLDRRARAA